MSILKSTTFSQKSANSIAVVVRKIVTSGGADCTVLVRTNVRGGYSIYLYGPQSQPVATTLDHLLVRSEGSGGGTCVFDAIIYDKHASFLALLRGLFHILNPKNNLIPAKGQQPKIVRTLTVNANSGTEEINDV
tara:strand:- start:212 stop:613 length:402 start_codon:yes stop_codon:yes gene_type:complete